jgi:hypothetical protein
MIARGIIHLFKHAFFAEVKKPLGRWNIHNYRQTTLKIRYANEDNCGTCGDYYKNATQIPENNGYKQNEELDDQYIYMMGAESLPAKVHISL